MITMDWLSPVDSLHPESGGPGDWSSSFLSLISAFSGSPHPGRMASSSCTQSLFRGLAVLFSLADVLVSKPLRGLAPTQRLGCSGRSGLQRRFHRNLFGRPTQKLSLCYFSLIENNILPSEYISICNDSHVHAYSINLCHPPWG